MKVSISWLKELINLKVPIEEVIRLLPLRTIGTKEITGNFIELDMKGYNRADLLSMRGVAYEIAAITDSKIKFYEQINEYAWDLSYQLQRTMKPLLKLTVKVENPFLCPNYCLAKIEGLKVGLSSSAWVKKLNDAGIRSVNNIADVTNLIMLEHGQPLHSFDAASVKDETIIVRTAREGEEIKTLDNKIRKLTASDLLIADPEKAIGIAGVMGGLNSEITDKTETVLLEAAIFDPVNLRKTASRLNLQSEASKRFQHGLTKTRMIQAFDAAIKMYGELGGKITGISITGNLQDRRTSIKLTRRKLNSLIGLEINPEEVRTYLEKLQFKVEEVESDWEVTVPYWRLDINIEEDLIEEVARMYGYERIKPKELSGKLPDKIDQSFFEFISKLKPTLANSGLTEVQTYSFYSTQVIENLKLKIENLVKLLNPMSAETEYLRDKLWPNLLEATAKNIRNGVKDVAIFEIGKVFSPQEEKIPKESYHLSIALSNGTDNPLAELSQIAQDLRLHLEGVKLNLKEYSHPTRYTNGMAEIHPRFVNKFGIEQRIAVLEINL